MIEIKGSDVYCPKHNTITLRFKIRYSNGIDYVFENGGKMTFRLKHTKNSSKDIITKSVNLVKGDICQEFMLTSKDTDIARDCYYYETDLIRDTLVHTVIVGKLIIT